MKLKYLTQLVAGLVVAALIFAALPITASTSKSLPRPLTFPMQDLGTIGGTLSQGNQVNESGVVIGENLLVTNPTTFRAFVYKDGVMTNLPMVGSGSNSFSRDINATGDIIGNFSGNGVSRGFLYRNNQSVEIPTLGGTFSTAEDINDSGDVVGTAWTAGDATQRAYVYRNGQITDLGTLGGSNSRAKAINNNGDIVGNAQIASGQTHAFIYRNGVMTDLGTLGGTSSDAYGINSLGEAIGVAALPGNAVFHGFVYRNGQMVDLGTLGGAESEPSAINDNGDVVGEADATGTIFTHAFVYRNGQMTDLHPAGYARSNARAINNNGDILINADLNLPAASFLYRNGQHIDLGTLGGPTTLGTDINNSGYITGRSYIATPPNDPPYHAFLVRAGTPPALSGKIVFDSKPTPTFLEIDSMNADGTGRTPLTTTGFDYDPSVSSDGSKIAFLSTRDGNLEI
jgi:probable HAF family extracellular repeat protein